MARQVIVGAGPTGSATARFLADEGDEVRLVARRAGACPHPDVERLALDATHVDALTAASEGATTIFMCAMPAYDRWPAEFPPISDAVMAAAERSGARVAIVSNVYPYGEGAPSPLTESLPLTPTTVKGRVRAEMWRRARASRVKVTEVRGSDYLGHGAGSVFTLLAAPRLRAGEAASMPADLDAPHAWTFTEDVARTLVAAARSEASWGRAFHVPSRHASVREVATLLCELAGAPPPTLTRMSREELEALGRADSIMREIVEMAYLFERPLVLDSSETERILGVRATSLDAMLRDTLRAS